MRQRISNLEEFKTLQEACIRARENEKRKVLVCCGTGCAARQAGTSRSLTN